MSNSVTRAKEALEPLVEKSKNIRCPRPEHRDRKPSAVLYPDGYKCFGCNRHGDSIDYVALRDGLTTSEVIRRYGGGGSRPPARPRNEALNSFTRSAIDAPGIAPFRSGVASG